MKSKPFASYCIATYRRPDFLDSTLRTIISQTEGDFEVIVSDNDPEGSAAPVVGALNDPRLRYRVNPVNVGMVKNFNAALSEAQGRYIVFITDDDPIVPDHLAFLRHLSNTHPGYGAYFGVGGSYTMDALLADTYGIRSGRNVPKMSGEVVCYSGEDFAISLFRGRIKHYLLWSCGMVRSEIARKYGMPDYGSPYLTDFSYVGLAGSEAGCVIGEKLLGWQTIHAGNFGREEFNELSVAARGMIGIFEQTWGSDSKVVRATRRFVAAWCGGHLLCLFRYHAGLAKKAALVKAMLAAAKDLRMPSIPAFFVLAGARMALADARRLLGRR